MESLITNQTKLTLRLSQEEQDALYFAAQVLNEIDDFLASHIVDYSTVNKTIIYSQDDDQMEIRYKDFFLAKTIIENLTEVKTLYSIKQNRTIT